MSNVRVKKLVEKVENITRKLLKYGNSGTHCSKAIAR